MPPTIQGTVAAGPQPRHLMVAGLIVAVAGLAAFALWQQFQLRRISEASRQAPASSIPPVAVRRLHGPRIVVAPPRSYHSPLDTRFPSRFSEAGGDRPMNTNAAEPPAALTEDPEFLRAFEVYREGMLDSRYASLFSRLNLSASELAAFKHLLAEKDNMTLDVVAISQATAPGTLTPEALRAGIQAAQGDVENSIRAALGDERYDQYRNYEDTIAQRQTVVQLERRLSYSPTPLSGPQAESLVKILADNAPSGARSAVPGVSLVVGSGTAGIMPVINPEASGLVTNEAILQAQGVLSAQQVAALRQIQVEQQAIMEAGRLILDGSPSALLPAPDWGLLLQ